MPTRKINDPPKICRHPEHDVPNHQVFEPGTWEHTCPSCGAVKVFKIPQVFCETVMFDDGINLRDYLSGKIDLETYSRSDDGT